MTTYYRKLFIPKEDFPGLEKSFPAFTDNGHVHFDQRLQAMGEVTSSSQGASK